MNVSYLREFIPKPAQVISLEITKRFGKGPDVNVPFFPCFLPEISFEWVIIPYNLYNATLFYRFYGEFSRVWIVAFTLIPASDKGAYKARFAE